MPSGVKKATAIGFIQAKAQQVPGQSAGMLSFGPSSSVKGGATGNQQADAHVRLAAPRFAFRMLAASVALVGAPVLAATAAGQAEPAIALPLWLFWLVAVTLLGLAAALFAQTVRTRRSLQRERLANRLIDHSPQLVCVLDPNGAVRHMNGTGRHWLRLTHPEIAWRRLHEIVQLGIDEAQASALQDVVAKAVSGAIVTQELTVKGRDGVAMTLELSIRAIPRTRDVPPTLLV